MPVVIVSHPVFGEGQALASRLGGQEILVHFRTGLKLWVLKRRLSFIQSEEALEKKFGIIQARRIIEALRMGIVPKQDCENFTFGRNKEIELLMKSIAYLKRGIGSCFLIEGEYGSGKTHLLEYLYHKALKESVVVSFVTLTPDEVSPSRPKRFWRELVFNLRYLKEDKEYTFRDLLRAAVDLDLKDNIFFGKLIPRLKKIEETSLASEVLWQWVEGESTKEYAVFLTNRFRIRGGVSIPALYDFSTASDFYSYLISSLSYIARSLGFHGLLILIDEAETVTHLWDMDRFLKGLNFLEGLVRVAHNDAELKKIDDKMIHNQMRPTPYIYREAYVTLIMATTPIPHNYEYLRLTSMVKNKIELTYLRSKDLKDCFYTLYKIYQTVYPNFELSEHQKEIIFDKGISRQEGIRDFVKFLIEVFDIYRYKKELSFIT